jgi:hypothetical protein
MVFIFLPLLFSRNEASWKSARLSSHGSSAGPIAVRSDKLSASLGLGKRRPGPAGRCRRPRSRPRPATMRRPCTDCRTSTRPEKCAARGRAPAAGANRPAARQYANPVPCGIRYRAPAGASARRSQARSTPIVGRACAAAGRRAYRNEAWVPSSALRASRARARTARPGANSPSAGTAWRVRRCPCADRRENHFCSAVTRRCVGMRRRSQKRPRLPRRESRAQFPGRYAAPQGAAHRRRPTTAGCPPFFLADQENQTLREDGVADGIRTHNNWNHNPGLYR